jgi:hypothetical protein
MAAAGIGIAGLLIGCRRLDHRPADRNLVRQHRSAGSIGVQHPVWCICLAPVHACLSYCVSSVATGGALGPARDRDAFSLDRRISTVILTLAAVRIVDRLPIAPQASPDAVAAGQVLAGIAGL